MVKLTRVEAFDVLGIEVRRSVLLYSLLPEQHGGHACIAAARC